MRPDDDRWIFTHSLIRDAVSTSMTSERRRGLHRAAARLFAPTDPAVEAEHLEAAGDPGAAAAWLRAARRALARHRLEVALDHAARGVSAACEGPGTHELELVRGESLELLGDLAAATAAFRNALVVAVDATGRGRARLGLASVLRRAERHDEALTALDEAHRVMADTDSHEEFARLEAIRSSIY